MNLAAKAPIDARHDETRLEDLRDESLRAGRNRIYLLAETVFRRSTADVATAILIPARNRNVNSSETARAA